MRTYAARNQGKSDALLSPAVATWVQALTADR
jgi:hypothetical protein